MEEKMSYYNHMHDHTGNKEVCKKCGKEFTWTEEGDIYPGGKDTEYIDCPYCGERNGSIRTSGFVYTHKTD